MLLAALALIARSLRGSHGASAAWLGAYGMYLIVVIQLSREGKYDRPLIASHYLPVSKIGNYPLFAQNDKTSEKDMKGDGFCVGMVFVQLPLSLPNSLQK